ncbi:ribonuclease H-like domain-containing protein [Tanacetum coccineum]
MIGGVGGGGNKIVWTTAMKIALHARNKLGFVNGSYVKTTYVTSVPLTDQWERCNVVVLSWLLSSISEDLYPSQVYSENFAEVWKEFKGTYDKLDESILEFDILTKLSPCTCEAKAELDSKLHVGFDEYDCVIQDLKRENVLGTGSEAVGLYIPDIKSTKCFLSFNMSKGLWHNRLGHHSDQVLYVLKDRLSSGKPTHIIPCETCHHAKQVREPFLLSEHKTAALCELIHLNLWGPYKVPTREGFKYFLTIVDGFSRAVWVYLLKSKDKVYDYFVSFVKLIVTQFTKIVKVISPIDDEREPSSSNTKSGSNTDDTAVEQSFVDDQDSVQIGEENFPKGNVPEK